MDLSGGAEHEQRAGGFAKRAGHDQLAARVRVAHFLDVRRTKRHAAVDEIVHHVVGQREVRHQI